MDTAVYNETLTALVRVYQEGLLPDRNCTAGEMAGCATRLGLDVTKPDICSVLASLGAVRRKDWRWVIETVTAALDEVEVPEEQPVTA